MNLLPAAPTKPTEDLPPLHTLLSATSFAHVAARTFTPKTHAFISSGATDELTLAANSSYLQRIWFRPRILRNVSTVSTATSMLGAPLALPLFISPTALAKLVHPDGEVAVARACGTSGAAMAISVIASCDPADILAASPRTPFFFQLYVNRDRSVTEALLARVLALRPAVRAVFLTVDCATPGKREADERLAAETLVEADAKGAGLARRMGGWLDPSMAWEDLPWLRRCLGDTPLVLKGIQCAEDALLAMRAGVQGIVVSNHGGRQLDGAPPAVITMLELRTRCPEIFDRMEVYVDSGIRRGTDILKCVCLGAKAVGIGRPALFALNYGQDGVEHLIDLLKDELETAMKLVGITDLSQAHMGLLNTGDIDHLAPRMETIEV